jgi:hypothetical protein
MLLLSSYNLPIHNRRGDMKNMPQYCQRQTFYRFEGGCCYCSSRLCSIVLCSQPFLYAQDNSWQHTHGAVYDAAIVIFEMIMPVPSLKTPQVMSCCSVLLFIPETRRNDFMSRGQRPQHTPMQSEYFSMLGNCLFVLEIVQ